MTRSSSPRREVMGLSISWIRMGNWFALFFPALVLPLLPRPPPLSLPLPFPLLLVPFMSRLVVLALHLHRVRPHQVFFSNLLHIWHLLTLQVVVVVVVVAAAIAVGLARIR